jgi:hypothetical protein
MKDVKLLLLKNNYNSKLMVMKRWALTMLSNNNKTGDEGIQEYMRVCNVYTYEIQAHFVPTPNPSSSSSYSTPPG